MTIDKRDVTFKSGDTFAAGWFFLPEHATSEARVPAVAMAHGLGAVKEMYLEPFARRFAEAGVAALVFDYRGFGASGGEPRRRISPHDQMEDYRNALTWLSSSPKSTPTAWECGAAASAAGTLSRSPPTTLESRR